MKSFLIPLEKMDRQFLLTDLPYYCLHELSSFLSNRDIFALQKTCSSLRNYVLWDTKNYINARKDRIFFCRSHAGYCHFIRNHGENFNQIAHRLHNIPIITIEDMFQPTYLNYYFQDNYVHVTLTDELAIIYKNLIKPFCTHQLNYTNHMEIYLLIFNLLNNDKGDLYGHTLYHIIKFVLIQTTEKIVFLIKNTDPKSEMCWFRFYYRYCTVLNNTFAYFYRSNRWLLISPTLNNFDSVVELNKISLPATLLVNVMRDNNLQVKYNLYSPKEWLEL